MTPEAARALVNAATDALARVNRATGAGSPQSGDARRVLGSAEVVEALAARGALELAAARAVEVRRALALTGGRR